MEALESGFHEVLPWVDLPSANIKIRFKIYVIPLKLRMKYERNMDEIMFFFANFYFLVPFAVLELVMR